MSRLLKNEWTIFVVALIASILTAVLTFANANSILVFLISAMGWQLLLPLWDKPPNNLEIIWDPEQPVLCSLPLATCRNYLSVSLRCGLAWSLLCNPRLSVLFCE